MFLKQSTTVTVILGPYVDDTDGKTAETGLSLSVYLSKNGGTAAARNSATAITHDRDGYYRVELNTTDTGTLGLLRVFASPTGALPVWRDFSIMPANVWDSFFGADLLQVDMTQIVGAAVSTSTAQLGVNAVQAGGTAWSSGAITSGAFATGAITAGVIAADAIGASELAADAATEIGTAVWATAARTLTAATNVTSTGAAMPITAGGLVSADVTAISTDTAAADNAEAFFDGTGYAGTGNTIPTVTTVGSVSGNVGGNVAGSVGSVSGAVGSVTGAVGSVTGAVGSVTGNVGGNVAGSVGSLAAQAKADVNAEVLDVISTDTFAEPGSVPAATSSLKDKIGFLFAALRNKHQTTATTDVIRNDADSGAIGTATLNEDGTTFSRGEYA